MVTRGGAILLRKWEYWKIQACDTHMHWNSVPKAVAFTKNLILLKQSNFWPGICGMVY